jgi:CheY-like chemotaxis protein
MDGSGRLRIELSEHQFSDCFCCASCKQAIDGSFVALSITDSGPGIAAEVLQRMFEPFFSTKEVGKGTGMGLSIVHGIVHDYGGHLVVRTAPGEGTTITVLLPVDADRSGVAPADKAGRGDQRASEPLDARVLLVDDDGDVVEYMRELLGSWGCQVTAFRDSPAARDHFAAHADDFTLALLDQTMPQLTGLELAKILRAARPALPVVLYTGYSDTLNEDVVREAGVAALVKKPIDRRSLRRVLDSLLQAPGSADTNG